MSPLGWICILRLGLIQAALCALVFLCTSTVNRVMVIKFALPAIVPGALVVLHYVVQVLRPRMGWGADMGGRRTPWIIWQRFGDGALAAAYAVVFGAGAAAFVAAAWRASGLFGTTRRQAASLMDMMQMGVQG